MGGMVIAALRRSELTRHLHRHMHFRISPLLSSLRHPCHSRYKKRALNAVAAKKQAILHTRHLVAIRRTLHVLTCVYVACQLAVQWDVRCREKDHQNPRSIVHLMCDSFATARLAVAASYASSPFSPNNARDNLVPTTHPTATS